MRASITALGFLAALVPAIAAAQGTPPPAPAAAPDPNAAPAATAPPPTYAPPPGQQPAYTPPPAQPTYAPPPPMAVAAPTAAPSLKGFSVWGLLPWSGYGAGARFMLPLGIQPLLRSSGVRDSFALEFGADVMHFSYGYLTYNYSRTDFVPVVGLMWNIWLNDQFALYPKLELGYWFHTWSGYDVSYGVRDNAWLFWDVAGGLLYKLNNGLTLRAEAGYAALKLGVGWLF